MFPRLASRRLLTPKGGQRQAGIEEPFGQFRLGKALEHSPFAPALPISHLADGTAIGPAPAALRESQRNQRDVRVLGRHTEMRVDFGAERLVHGRDTSAEAVGARGETEV